MTNLKKISVTAWRLTDLEKALEAFKKDNTDDPQDWGFNHGINAAINLVSLYLGVNIAEAKIESNVEILNKGEFGNIYENPELLGKENINERV